MKEDKSLTVGIVAALFSIVGGILGALASSIYSTSIAGIWLGALIPSAIVILMNWQQFLNSKNDNPFQGLMLPLLVGFAAIPGIFAGMIVMVIRELVFK